MLRNKIYYRLKPFLPWVTRYFVRRLVARRIRKTHQATWPINEAAGRKPEGWPGWPEGKKFAFVITHDVEGPEGLEKCRLLAELEMELGFRSSFNFIPEGPYVVPSDLRRWLTDHGFEVGVHDLEHDGKLFNSRRTFAKKAQRINGYLRDWNAVGFRAGFMLRDLEWYHDLDIQYDASTFDTDPFEPQPDGTGTIFPFWVHTRDEGKGIRDESTSQSPHSPTPSLPPSPTSSLTPPLPPPQRGGYVELPYTLPQDSTLFLLLGEKTSDIWLGKLDWIAEHAGLALVNVHPDYVNFAGEVPTSRDYPLAHYRRLLEHVRESYATRYWHVLPAQVAKFVAKIQPQPILRRAKRVAMITHSFYESDNRVTRYAEALVERGDHVQVFALRRSEEIPREETIAGVQVTRIQNRFGKKERSKLDYAWPSIRFLLASSWRLARCHARHPFDLIHVHNIPDFLVFAAWWPKLSGAKVILDIHDIVPEFYASKFSAKEHTTTVALLKWFERLSANFADHVIISNHLWHEKYTARTDTRSKSSVFINNVDTRVFHPSPRMRQDGKLIVLFPGGLQWHQGLDIALRAFRRVNDELPQSEFHIYGEGNMKPALVALSNELGFNGQVRFFEPLRIGEIAKVMANADLGVVPKRADSFGNEAYSTKIMEFMSLGVPVVASRTRIDQYYFDDSVLRFFESGDSDSLAQEMIDLLRNPELREQIAMRARQYASNHCWEKRRTDYLALVDRLCSRQ